MKKISRIIMLSVIILICSLALFACGKPEKLSVPQNLKISSETLTWDTVDNATKYSVDINGIAYSADINSYSLSLLTEPKTYKIKVKAIGDGKKYSDSDWSGSIDYPAATAYIITFNADGGENVPSSVTATLNAAMPKITNRPIKNEHVFSGFFDKKTGGTKYYNSDLSSSKTFDKTEDTTLYAQWQQGSESLNYEKTDDETAYIVTGTEANIAEIIIPEIHDNLPVIKIGDEAFIGCGNLTNIVIPNSITSIGNWALKDCVNLTDMVMPNGITYIGIGAFQGCGLTKIDIPDSVVTINAEAFYNCGKLTDVIIGKNVITIGDGAFHQCVSLKNITIPNSVESIGTEAFFSCESLKDIVIPDSIENIGYETFAACGNLVNITIPDSVITIGDAAFYNCVSLTNIVIPNSVESIGYSAFDNCDSLTNIVIPNSVISIGDSAFYECGNLTNIVLSKNVTNIGSYAFYKCNNLTIYCEAESKPAGWDSEWNYSNRPVIWNCMLSSDKTYVVSFAAPSNISNTLSAPYRTGYTFGGWKNSVGTIYQMNELENITSGIILTAIWIED